MSTPYSPRLFFTQLSLLLTAASLLLLPFPLLWLAEGLAPIWLPAIWLGIMAVYFVLDYSSLILCDRDGEQRARHFANRLWQGLEQQPPQTDIAIENTSVLAQTLGLQLAFSARQSTLLKWVPSLGAVVVVATILDPRLCLVLCLGWFCIYQLQPRRATRLHVKAPVQSLLTALPVSKGIALEDRLEEIWQRQLQNTAERQTRKFRRHAQQNWLAQMGRLLLHAALLTWAIHWHLSVPVMVLYALLVELSLPVLHAIYEGNRAWSETSELRKHLPVLLQNLLQHPEPEGTQAITSLPFPDATHLFLQNVTLKHQEKILLQDFCLDLAPGQLIAFSADAEETADVFAQLFNRQSEPVNGQLSLGRTDLKRFRLRVLRNYVTYIGPQAFLLPLSVRENLELAQAEHAEIDEQKLFAALHAADAYDFVQQLPNKIDAPVEGLDLNPSEQLSLHIARALLREQSQIFVFNLPAGTLNRESRRSILRHLTSLAERDAIVLWRALDDEERALCNRSIHLEAPATLALKPQVELDFIENSGATTDASERISAETPAR